MKLRHSHPLLFKGVVMMMFLKLAFGVDLLTSPGDFDYPVYQNFSFALIPREAWGVLFLSSGLLGALGIFKPLVMRVAAAVSCFAFLAWAFTFFVASFSVPFPIYALFVYFVLAGLEYASLSEPRTNPLAAKDKRWNKD